MSSITRKRGREKVKEEIILKSEEVKESETSKPEVCVYLWAIL